MNEIYKAIQKISEAVAELEVSRQSLFQIERDPSKIKIHVEVQSQRKRIEEFIKELSYTANSLQAISQK